MHTDSPTGLAEVVDFQEVPASASVLDSVAMMEIPPPSVEDNDG